jgi:hypothetical protein
MDAKHLAIMIYGDIGSGRNALTEEKYKDLASAFSSQGFEVESVLYNDRSASDLALQLLKFDAVLVWVNPIEGGKNRDRLDLLLTEISAKGCFVSTLPEVILKMGTKDVLYKTRQMGWGSDIKIYTSFQDFTEHFPLSLETSKTRVLKQHRGNGGNGVFKIILDPSWEGVTIIHAGSMEKKVIPLNKLYDEFKPFFLHEGLLVDQEWNEHSTNGMVRCYVSGTNIAGFGYQEINALYELDGSFIPPGKRYYFTEHCGLFSDLKELMEKSWIPQLQQSLSINKDMMPVIWDADFFINNIDSKATTGKYTLCEINVSCVSPFPPSAIKFMVDEVVTRIKSTNKAVNENEITGSK